MIVPLSFFLLNLFYSPAFSFSLNVTGPDWDYSDKDLANTTSDACKEAYSAEIDCDDTLVGLVASMRPAFDPTSVDLDRVCTATCQESLKSYIANIQSTCVKKGDGADIYLGGAYSNIGTVPVEIVGKIFEYTFAKDCRKDTTGAYCYFSEIGNVEGVTCTDTCDVTFYADAHNYEGSAYEFNYYYLVGQSDWWMDKFQKGWNNVKHCSGVEDVASTSTSLHPQTTSTKDVSGTTTTKTGTTASASSTTALTQSTSVSTSNATASQDGVTPSHISNTGNHQELSGAMGLLGIAVWTLACL